VAGSVVTAVSSYLPDRVLTNDELSAIFPEWSPAKILRKTGILERRIAAEDETASDLGVRAAQKLLERECIDPSSVEFLIFCSQSPDYFLPTTACIIQERLGLAKTIGAFDINQGCSGFVYGLSVANGLIESGAVKNVLLITADTYSKFINHRDRSVRSLFGDAAAATFIAASDQNSQIGNFVFGTDGSGSENLIVPAGGLRLSSAPVATVADQFGNHRSPFNLYMNGSEVLSFSLQQVPHIVRRVLKLAALNENNVDYYLFHQANKFMLDALIKKLNLPNEKVPRYGELTGNTVSSTIPLLLEDMILNSRIKPGVKLLLCGFGVGYSCAGCTLDF